MDNRILFFAFLAVASFYGAEGRQCYKCDSSVNPECVFWSNVASIQKSECDDPTDMCAVRVIAKGKTERGCLGDLDVEKCGDANCKQCETDLCNGDVFPTARRKCHQCSGDDECKKDLTTATPKVCQMYDFQEKCFIYVAVDGTTERGCLSDPGKTAICNASPAECESCSAVKPGCNNHLAVSDPELECYTCNKDDPQCLWSVNSPTSTTKHDKCKTLVRYGQTEQCYSYREDDDVERGCMLDLEDKNSPAYKACTNKSDTSCTLCNTVGGCNSETYKVQQCYRCSSTNPRTDQKVCETDVRNLDAIITCPTPVQGYNDRGCFTMQQVGVTYRGCVTDMPEEWHKDCNNNKWCNICQDSVDPCNDAVLTPRSGQDNIVASTCAVAIAVFTIIVQQFVEF